MADDEAPRYRLGPRSTRGLVAGWRGGQIACVALGSVAAVGLLRSVGGLGGAFLAFLAAAASFALAVWPIAGRSAEEWAPTLVRFGAQQAVARAEAVAVSGSLRPWAPGRARPRPGPSSRLRLESLGSSTTGVVVDERAGAWTAVMVCGGTGFALLDEAQRAERIARWSGVLAAVAREGGGLHRLQWVARTLPAYLLGAPPELPPAPADRTGPAGAYGELLAGVSQELWAREVLLAVSVRAAGSRPKAAGGPAGTLSRQLEIVGDRVRAAGLACGPPLGVHQLATCLRRAVDVDPIDDPVSWPWPVGVHEEWGRLRTDGSWHATYWVAEWPRGDVAAGWLLPLIVAGGERHTVALTMAPLPAAAARRRAERERTSGAADAELRRRHGFAMTARARGEQDARQQREAELAEGHAGYRFSGYVTVTAADPVELERSCVRVEQAAAVSQLEIRRLYGAQEAGWCCTLPIGRGCTAR